MQHALKHVERPGGSHEDVGRKKKIVLISYEANVFLPMAGWK